MKISMKVWTNLALRGRNRLQGLCIARAQALPILQPWQDFDLFVQNMLINFVKFYYLIK